MARSKRKWPVILGVAFVAIVLGALFYTSGEGNALFPEVEVHSALSSRHRL